MLQTESAFRDFIDGYFGVKEDAPTEEAAPPVASGWVTTRQPLIDPATNELEIQNVATQFGFPVSASGIAPVRPLVRIRPELTWTVEGGLTQAGLQFAKMLEQYAEWDRQRRGCEHLELGEPARAIVPVREFLISAKEPHRYDKAVDAWLNAMDIYGDSPIDYEKVLYMYRWGIVGITAVPVMLDDQPTTEIGVLLRKGSNSFPDLLFRWRDEVLSRFAAKYPTSYTR